MREQTSTAPEWRTGWLIHHTLLSLHKHGCELGRALWVLQTIAEDLYSFFYEALSVSIWFRFTSHMKRPGNWVNKLDIRILASFFDACNCSDNYRLKLNNILAQFVLAHDWRSLDAAADVQNPHLGKKNIHRFNLHNMTLPWARLPHPWWWKTITNAPAALFLHAGV